MNSAKTTLEDGVTLNLSRTGSRLRWTCLSICVALAALAMTATPAHAAFGVSVFDGGTSGPPEAGVTDPFATGPAFTQAGGHPYEAWTAFQVNQEEDPNGFLRPQGGGFRNVQVDLPPGLIGNPTAVPACPKTRRIAVDGNDVQNNPPETFCSPASVVGLALLTFSGDPFNGIGPVETYPSVVFNVEPPPGVAATFGFNFSGSQIFLDATVRADGEYAVQIRSRNAVNVGRPLGVKVALWGNPSDATHDAQRCIFLTPIPVEISNLLGIPVACDSLIAPNPPGTPMGPNPFPDHIERKAFLTMPTSCLPDGVGLETRMRMEPWDTSQAPAEASFVSHLPPHYPADPSTWGPPQGPTGCDQLPFDPSFSARPDSTLADSPTGLTVELGFPQEGLDDPEGIATAHLRNASVTLPEGMTVNPSAADGLVACSDEQVGFGSVARAQCPEASKLATVTATTPVIEEALSGSVYVGSQMSDDPESGDMFRIVLVLENLQRGIVVKLLGKVSANRDTGRLVATFAGNPQVPVSDLSLHFKNGPRAPLAMPPDCGVKTVDAQLTSWGGQVAQRSDAFTVACTPDLGGFAPSFSAGSVTPSGGTFSPFALTVERPDRQQYLRGLAVELPPGLLGKLKGIQQCAGPQADAGTCAVESRVGTATVGAGAGSNPFFLKGSASLTGPYKGAPFGLSVAVPAVAGPFNLGMVVVRQALFVDPIDAHVTVVSDPLPTIVKGVPVRLRSVHVDVDRPGFTLNPTSCAPKTIKATLASAGGTTREATQHFQVGDCQALPLRPRLSLRLTGAKETKSNGHPGVRAVLTQGGGQANPKSVAVKLPLSLALDPDRAQSKDLCEFEAGLRVDCPARSIIGRARAITPVLNRPLEGPVYFVKNVRRHPKTGRLIRTLPTLLIPLKGEVDLTLRAQTTVSRGKLVSTFPTVPDAPVSRFELNLTGGKRGILIVTQDRLCGRKQIADVEFDGHNGKRFDPAVTMRTPCQRGARRTR